MSSVASLPLPLRAPAPAKINLGLFLGPIRADGRHELVTVMQSISLADELTLRWAPGEGAADERGGAAGGRSRGTIGDRILCPGVPGPPDENLAALALQAFRTATGWDVPALELHVAKRVPVAAGLGGGSGDAAAALRLAAAASGLGEGELLLELAARLGADVSAQVAPGRWLARGAGEQLHALPDPRQSCGVLVLPCAAGLSTAAVYAQADRMDAPRSRSELDELAAALAAELARGATLPSAELLHNDLQDAARVLCREVDPALAQARAKGADIALVSGSGPTVLGLFDGDDGLVRARAAASALAAERRAAGVREAIAAEFVGAGVAGIAPWPAAAVAAAAGDPAIRHNSPR